MKIFLILFISLFCAGVFAEAKTMGALHNVAGKGHFGYGDYETAIEEFRKGAELDDADAQYNLGSMYFKGQGTTQDYVRAHMWWNIAASKGIDEAQRSRDKVEKKMTSSDISKAQDLARECVASKHKNC